MHEIITDFFKTLVLQFKTSKLVFDVFIKIGLLLCFIEYACHLNTLNIVIYYK